MSRLTFWLLTGSVVVAVIIMAVTFIIMRVKIKGVTKEYSIVNQENVDSEALKREDHGQLLWDLKEKTKNPLDDLSMEFAINTAIRNKYQRLVIDGFEEKYEETTLLKKTSLKKSNATFDFALVNFDDKTIDRIDSFIKRAEPKSMILIVNARKGKLTKDMMSYLRYTGIRNEHQRIGEGIILLAK